MKPSNVAVRRARREERYNVNYNTSQKYSFLFMKLGDRPLAAERPQACRLGRGVKRERG